MYKLSDLYNAGVENHFQLYDEKLKNAVDLHLTPPIPPGKRKPGRPKPPPFQILVGTYARSFFENVRDNDSFRKRLLTDDYNSQLLLIETVETEIKDALNSTGNRIVVDDMNERAYFIYVCKEIFVKGFYDNSDNFNKSNHIINKNLRICPYCGRAYIFYSLEEDNPDKCEYKPQIDHFLPKDSYPYLSANYYNLIPSCTPCNTLENKGSNDPLGKNQEHRFLMNPYEFDNNQITFSFVPTIYTTSDDPIQVTMRCEREYDVGYKEWLKLEKFYQGHGKELKRIYTQMAGLRSLINNPKSFNIPENFLELIPQIIYGFDFDTSSPSEISLYKFYKDTYLKMRRYALEI